MAQNETSIVFGTKHVYGTAGSTSGMTTFSGVIAAVRGFRGLEGKFTDNTNVDQASTAEQKTPTTYNPGRLQLSLAFAKATLTTVLGFFQVMKSWKTVHSNGSSTDWFDGFINSYQPRGIDDKGRIVIDIDIEASGAGTWTE